MTANTNLHTVTLPGLAVFLLSGALEQAGWAITSRDHGEAFRLLETVIPDQKYPEELRTARTQREARAQNQTWCCAEISLEITERQRDTIKKCLTTLREKSALPPGWATQALLVAFGLSDE